MHVCGHQKPLFGYHHKQVRTYEHQYMISTTGIYGFTSIIKQDKNSHLYFKIVRGIYNILQAGIVAEKCPKKRLQIIDIKKIHTLQN